MNTSAIILFIRNPVLGKVKTRLAKSIGDENALQIYKVLVTHTRQVTGDLLCDKYVYYSETITDDEWDSGIFKKKLQKGADLGEKMANAFRELFAEGYQKLLLIGSDCHELNTGVLQNAFDSLDDSDLVVGPAVDGGYYLMGMKAPHKELFQGIEWSTEKVFQQTISAIQQKKLSAAILPLLNDVDGIEDLTETLIKKAGIIIPQ